MPTFYTKNKLKKIPDIFYLVAGAAGAGAGVATGAGAAGAGVVAGAGVAAFSSLQADNKAKLNKPATTNF
jgi:hypothetical protein